MTSISNRDWLMRLAHEAPDELATWMGAEHVEPTNGIGGETNGIHDGITLPEGDAVAIMRQALDNQSSPTFCALARYLGISGGLSVSWAEAEDALRVLADMVERDYVRREAYDYAHREFNRMNEERREAFAERDEWKAKAEGSSKVRAGSSSAKRAAAVERLRECRYLSTSDLMCAMAGFGHEPHTGEQWRDALIDLLEDDELRSNDGVVRSNDGVTNLEWLFENDYETLRDQMGGQPCSCCVVGCKEDLGSDEACAKALREWLMAPHENGIRRGNDPETPDSAEIPQKTGEQWQKDDALDSREKLEADIRANCHHEAMPAGGRSWMLDDGIFEHVVISWLDRQEAITERECIDKRIADQIGAMWESQKIAELQAEIAKRDKGIERLKKRRDELELRVNSLVAELGDTEGENLILRRQRDEAREQLDADWPKLLRCLESDYNIKASWDGHRKIWFTERADGSAVDAVREFAARYEQRIEELEWLRHSFENKVAAQSVEIAGRDKRIAELEAERDGWRMRCGELLDAAHEMHGIADEWDEEVR